MLDRGASLWNSLRDSALFVTGGTGFIGRWLLGALASANQTYRLKLAVTILTRGGEYRQALEGAFPGAPFRFLIGDVRDFRAPPGQFSFMIHAAAESTRPVADRETRETIVEGTKRCLDFAFEREVRRFLFVSSGSIYGRQPPRIARIPEEYSSPPSPEPEGLNEYGRAKREAERYVLAASGLPATIARGFAFVGPHLALDRHFAIGNFIRDALAGGQIVVRSDGTPLRSYLYAADLTVWLLTILVRGEKGFAYNVGSEESISIGELATLVANVVNPRAEVRVLGIPTGDPPVRYLPSTERARSELGLEAWTPLREAVSRTASWYSSQGTR